ncbi:MAG: DUF4230 domain-containing protein [Synechococcales cyanobacterium M58_A2018_015]|nr:DUF4230 domain-containing protein [Synechococcales cyanobacterium M58_A2018_015]
MSSYKTRDDWSFRNGGIQEPSLPSYPGHVQFLWKQISRLAAGGVVVTLLLVGAGIWRTGGQLMGGLRDLVTAPQPEPKVDVRSLVVQQVRSASELTTAVYTMESVVPASRERTLGGYVIGKTTLLYIAHAEVRAGVDLSVLQPQDVQVNGDSIVLRLPPPQILDSKIDVNRSKVYDYDRGFLGLGPDVAPELQELAQRETLNKIVEAACSDGVLQTANDRAKLAVSQLLTTAGYSQFSVETQTPGSCTAPANPANIPAAPSLPPETTPPAPSLSPNPASKAPPTAPPTLPPVI